MKKALLCFLACAFISFAQAQDSPANSVNNALVLKDGTLDKLASLQEVEDDAKSFGDSFKMFPNPVENKLTIKAKSSIDSYKIYNVLGTLVLHGKTMNNLAEVNVSDLQIGVYMLEVNSGVDHVTRKLIKK